MELIKRGGGIAYAMLMGGVLLGFIPGVAAYFITRIILTSMHQNSKTFLVCMPLGWRSAGK